MSVIAWEELHGAEVVARINQIIEIIESFAAAIEKIHYIEECVEDILENVVCGVCNGSAAESPKSDDIQSPRLLKTSTTVDLAKSLRVQLPKEYPGDHTLQQP